MIEVVRKTMLIRQYYRNFIKYRALLKELIIRDLKVKYKNSVLGILWSLLNPALTMLVMTIIFSHLFRFDIENFPAYLLSGNIIFSFFSMASSSAMMSIISNGSLMGKIYIPKYIFPVSKVGFEFINTLISLVALLIVIYFTDVPINYSIIFSFFPLIYTFIFALGVGLFLSSMAVFFRDIIHIYGVIITAWMYFTPLFYPVDIIPEKFKFLINLNPIYYFVEAFRSTMIYMRVPSFELNMVCLSFSLMSLVLGLLVFYRSQNKFILYV